MQADECLRDLVGIHQRVWAMDEQQVDVIGAQIAQAAVDRCLDVRGTGVVVLDAVLGALGFDQGDAALGDDLELFAQGGGQGQGLAESSLNAVTAVDVRMVDRGDAQLDAGFDEVDQGLGA